MLVQVAELNLEVLRLDGHRRLLVQHLSAVPERVELLRADGTSTRAKS